MVSVPALADVESPQFDPADAPPIVVFFLMAIGFAIAVFAAGVGFAFALFAAGCTVLLVGVGIVSSAVVIGVLRRRVASGVRAFHYMLSAAIAGPATMGALWLGRTVLPIKLSPSEACIIGFIIGIIGGLCFAFQMDVVARIARRRFFPPTSTH